MTAHLHPTKSVLTPPPDRRVPPPRVPELRLPLGRRRLGAGALTSMLLHGALLFLLLYKGTQFLAAGSGDGDGPRGGGGGGGRPLAQFLNLPAYSAPQEVTVPAPSAVAAPVIALPDPVKLDLPEPVLQPALAVQTPAPVGAGPGTGGGPGQGPGSGGGQGGGVGTGIGNDSGPGSGGNGGYILSASPRKVIYPSDCLFKPSGHGVMDVRFWVTEDGRVERVELDPAPKDAGCRREFTAQMMETRFFPATRQGQPVPNITTIRISR